MRLSWGTVLEVTEASEKRQRLCVRIDGRRDVDAINYLDIAPALEEGDRALLNMTALDLGLGTGGVAFVVPTEEKQDKYEIQGQGRIMKLRYTPLQREVFAVEEQGSLHHEHMQSALSLAGLPVVCCALASQVPLVAAAIKAEKGDARVVLCMTDEASLMLAFSDLFTQARATGLIDTIITCGQALGGDAEAITLHSAMLAALHVFGADVCIVSIGPGTPGSATPFGHGGIAQGEAINAVAALDGIAVAPLRVSFADKRERHRAVSHHSITALSRICLARAIIPVPKNLSEEQTAEIVEMLELAGLYERHDITEIGYDEGKIDLRGLTVTTMGRTQAEDPAFFSAAYAAGALAATLIDR